MNNATMSTGAVETGTILDRILARTAADLSERRSSVPVPDLERRIEAMPSPIGFRRALMNDDLAVIAEIKRASPSKGRFPVEIELTDLAAEYLKAGANAISVLTDTPFFQGSLEDLAATAEIVHASPTPIPVLRKDFIVDEYQLLEARVAEADAVLLIAAALTDVRLAELQSASRSLGLDALVEVHDKAEMERALALGFELIGINNRDLRTFDVELSVSERLAPIAVGKATLVGESGIFDRADALRMAQAGIDAILVGEALILSPNRAAAINAFKGVSRTG